MRNKETALDLSHALNNTLAAALCFLELQRTNEALEQLRAACKYAGELHSQLTEPPPMTKAERAAFRKVGRGSNQAE